MEGGRMFAWISMATVPMSLWVNLVEPCSECPPRCRGLIVSDHKKVYMRDILHSAYHAPAATVDSNINNWVIVPSISAPHVHMTDLSFGLRRGGPELLCKLQVGSGKFQSTATATATAMAAPAYLNFSARTPW